MRRTFSLARIEDKSGDTRSLEHMPKEEAVATTAGTLWDRLDGTIGAVSGIDSSKKADEFIP
jgi:hypothetical protein